jgi:uncharacterized membrane protein YdbT with pleckstrin-like domain
MRLSNRMFGVMPGREAKLERLLWFRRYYLRNLPLVAFVDVVALLFLSWWFLALLLLPWLAGFARVNVEIRREKRRAGV